jgi:hypothetical protein
MPEGRTAGAAAEVILTGRKKMMANTMQKGKNSTCSNNFSIKLPFCNSVLLQNIK